MKVAIIHEWLVTIGGSENVSKAILDIFPQADIFTLVAHKDTVKKMGLENRNITTSFIQRLPFAEKKYRSYLPLFPLAVEQFDLGSYDLIISSSHAVAKGVITHHNQVHICYCHSPMRYAWDLYHQYRKESGLDKGIKGMMAAFFLHKLRNWDVLSVNRVDHFVANSSFIAGRIKKIYNRDSEVIYPNVAVNEFPFQEQKEDFFVTASRLVPYKKIDIIVEAFAGMPDKKLVVIGDGPDYAKIKRIAGPNVQMLGFQEFNTLKSLLGKAKAFLFAAEEDFGILPVEAQACGTPVIALGKGGCKETVIQGVTGILFEDQSVACIRQAVRDFDNYEFDYYKIHEHAKKFSEQRFKEEFQSFCMKRIKI